MIKVTRRTVTDPDVVRSIPPNPGTDKQVVNIFVTPDKKLQVDYEES